MDAQIKKGFLDVCVLAVLARGDSYGYQLITELGSVVEISESTLYPILKRLESGGQLSTYTREHCGRLRRYYRITPTGAARLNEFRADWQELERINHFITGGRVW